MPQRISSINASLSADSRDLTSAITGPTDNEDEIQLTGRATSDITGQSLLCCLQKSSGQRHLHGLVTCPTAWHSRTVDLHLLTHYLWDWWLDPVLCTVVKAHGVNVSYNWTTIIFHIISINSSTFGTVDLTRPDLAQPNSWTTLLYIASFEALWTTYATLSLITFVMLGNVKSYNCKKNLRVTFTTARTLPSSAVITWPDIRHVCIYIVFQ